MLQFHQLAKSGYTFGWFTRAFVVGWQHFKQCASSRVTFRVNEGVIQWLNASRNFEEPCRLHKGCRSHPWHLLQFFTRLERAMLLTIFDDGISNTSIDSRYVLEQFGGGGIHLDAREVNAGYYHSFQRIRQFLLVYIMLVHAHTDGFGVNFHQFRQWVLQATGNRNRAALRRIERRKLLTRNLRGRIDGGTGFVDNNIANLTLLARLLLQVAYQPCHQLFRFT